MTMLFKLRFVFGLSALCWLHFIPSEAQIKLFSRKNLQVNIPRQRPSLPSTSRVLTSNRQPPIQMTARVNSMESINLQPLSSSTSDIYRSISETSLNRPNSPAIMREISNLHRQAAATLNSRNLNIVQPQPENTLIQRLRPSTERMSLIGKYIKNGGIGVAAAGGFISVVNAFASDDNNNSSKEKELKNDNENVTSHTTTPVSEFTNPLGVFK